METVAGGHEIAVQPLFRACPVSKDDGRRLRFRAFDGGDGRAEVQVAAAVQPGVEQVRDDLLLAVDHDAASARVGREIKVVVAPAEAEFDPVVFDSLAVHARAGAEFPQQLGRAVLQHPGPDAPLDVLA